MKTSNKLLAGFFGVLVLLLLISDIILRVNYSKGITNSNSVNMAPNRPLTKQRLQPFKVLMLQGTGDNNNTVHLSDDDTSILQYNGDATIRYGGDTLFLTYKDCHFIKLSVPVSMETVHLQKGELLLGESRLPRLTVYGGANTNCFLRDVKMQAFTFTAAKGSGFYTEGKNEVDSIRLSLGKGSTLQFRDMVYRTAEIKVDSLRELDVSGQALEHITLIK